MADCITQHPFDIQGLLQETSEELGKLLKSLAMHNKDLEPVQAAVVRDAQR